MSKEKIIGVCKFCNTEKQLCKAHIVPKSFYAKKLHLNVSQHLPYPKRLWEGVYDKNILCHECDGQFGQYEAYAKTLLMDNLETYKVSDKAMYFIPDDEFDYKKFRKFIVFLVWKASISKEDYCKNVDLGPYEQKASAILNNHNNYDRDFGFAVIKNSNLELKDIHIPPVPMKFAGVSGYHFIFTGFSIYIIPNYKNFLNKGTKLNEIFASATCGLSIIETDDLEMTGSCHITRIWDEYLKISNN